ncbi:MAG TPA: hypothetical protein VF211_15850 [Burkholderiales bacterium]
MSGERQAADGIYARWLAAGTGVAFAFALLSLLLYLSGALPAFVSPDELPRLWTLSAAEMMRETGAPPGWRWLEYVGYGDYLTLLGIALFALLAALCTARVVPAFLAAGERLQALLAALQVLVLLVAMLGLFPGAH